MSSPFTHSPLEVWTTSFSMLSFEDDIRFLVFLPEPIDWVLLSSFSLPPFTSTPFLEWLPTVIHSLLAPSLLVDLVNVFFFDDPLPVPPLADFCGILCATLSGVTEETPSSTVWRGVPGNLISGNSKLSPSVSTLLAGSLSLTSDLVGVCNGVSIWGSLTKLVLLSVRCLFRERSRKRRGWNFIQLSCSPTGVCPQLLAVLDKRACHSTSMLFNLCTSNLAIFVCACNQTRAKDESHSPT